MESLIRILIILCGLMFIIKYYVHSKINAGDKRSSTLNKMVFGEIGLGIMLPIPKRRHDFKEWRLITIANIAITLLYVFFLSAMMIALIYFKGKY
jgi:uncharacterized membrane protein